MTAHRSEVLETARRVDTVILDKTGTIATGQTSPLAVHHRRRRKPRHIARVTGAPVEQRHTAIQNARATRTVADHAVDVQDCVHLLAMLGLDARDGKRDD